jgi:hypothetical protein
MKISKSETAKTRRAQRAKILPKIFFNKFM